MTSSSVLGSVEHMSSVLLSILDSSLESFDEDPHLKLLSFFDDGITPEGKAAFMKSWSRTKLVIESFGRRPASGSKGGDDKAIKDPHLFSKHFIDDLWDSDKDLSQIRSICSTLASCASSTVKQSDNIRHQTSSASDYSADPFILDTLQATNNIGADIASGLLSTYSRIVIPTAPATLSSQREESIMAFRQCSRTAKKFSQRGQPQTAAPFFPIDMNYLGRPEVQYGSLVLKKMQKFTILDLQTLLPQYAETIPTITIRFNSRQPMNQSKAWAAYHIFNDSLVARKLNIFPIPFTVERDPSIASTSFVFERPVGRPLSPLLGSHLARQLRNFPSVLLTWCTQFGYALTMASDLDIVKEPTLRDVFVRDNGCLVLGNCAIGKRVDATLKLAKPPNIITNFIKDLPSSTSSGDLWSTLSESQRVIVKFMQELLTTVLGLSRRLPVDMRPRGIPDTSADAADDTARPSAEQKMDAGAVEEEVIVLSTDSTVELLFDRLDLDIRVSDELEPIFDAEATNFSVRDNSPDLVTIEVFGDLHCVDVRKVAISATSGRKDTRSALSVRAKAKAKGSIVLRISAIDRDVGQYSSHATSSFSDAVTTSQRSRVTRTLRISVIDNASVAGASGDVMELFELLALLEFSYRCGQPVFLRALCLQKMWRDSETKNMLKEEEKEIAVAHDWQEITRILNDNADRRY